MNRDTFAMVCYMTLMNHHGAGLIEAHPSYIEEKRAMLNSGYDAFGYLDGQNQSAVISYLKHWKIEVPEGIKVEVI